MYLSIKLLLCTAVLEEQLHNLSWPNISGVSGRAIAGLSYGWLKAIRHKFHCQLPSKELLVIGTAPTIPFYGSILSCSTMVLCYMLYVPLNLNSPIHTYSVMFTVFCNFPLLL